MKFDFRFLFSDYPVTTLVYYPCSVVRLAFCENHFQLESFIFWRLPCLPISPSHVSRRTSPSAVQDSYSDEPHHVSGVNSFRINIYENARKTRR